MNVSPGPIDHKASSEVKVALFRSLFRGREDVYARRFESRKTGKSGYAPACENEPISTSRCWLECSIGVVVAMRRSVTGFSSRPARFRVGRWMWSCHRIRLGSAITPGSVRRLVRDGVDAPLANLFVHVARPMPSDGEGVDRARSATEAFLYRRLDTLQETKGRFRVNVALPFAFDGLGQLEVDLLCSESRVAVELDGAQHLADPIAYRRDRRKDQLLQENGYLVLRFLAEDVGKELDSVLDAILRAVSHRRSLASTTEPLQFVRPKRA